MIHHNICPLCYSEAIAPVLSCKDHFISKETFKIYRCAVCGFAFTQDYPDEDKIGSYYESEDYISHSDSSKGLINKVYRIVRKAMLIKKRESIKKLTGLQRGSILDIGSGTGHFAAAMKKAGWQVKGIEINEKARELSVTAFRLDIISPGQITTLEPESFDCITLWHVLEHFQDPFGYFENIKRLLKPGGLCVIALPNCSSLDAKYYRESWAAYDVPRHLWHFSPSSFMSFAKRAGLEVETIKSLPLDVFYISLLSEKYKGLSLPVLSAMPKALFFSFMSFFNRKRSSSMVYILRKTSG